MNRDDWSDLIPVILLILVAALLLGLYFMTDYRLDRLEQAAYRAEVLKRCDQSYHDALRRDTKLDSTLVRLVVEGTPQCEKFAWYPGKRD